MRQRAGCVTDALGCRSCFTGARKMRTDAGLLNVADGGARRITHSPLPHCAACELLIRQAARVRA